MWILPLARGSRAEGAEDVLCFWPLGPGALWSTAMKWGCSGGQTAPCKHECLFPCLHGMPMNSMSKITSVLSLYRILDRDLWKIKCTLSTQNWMQGFVSLPEWWEAVWMKRISSPKQGWWGQRGWNRTPAAITTGIVPVPAPAWGACFQPQHSFVLNASLPNKWK